MGLNLLLILALATLPPEIGLLLLFAIVGIFAGGVRAAQRTTPHPALYDVLSQAAGGGLSAFCAGAVCLGYWGPDRLYVELVVAVLAGWLGTVLIDMAAQAALRAANQRIENGVGKFAPPPESTPPLPMPKKDPP
jgi:hypothetical protein